MQDGGETEYLHDYSDNNINNKILKIQIQTTLHPHHILVRYVLSGRLPNVTTGMLRTEC